MLSRKLSLRSSSRRTVGVLVGVAVMMAAACGGNHSNGAAPAMTQACNDKIFMLVGQGFVLDAGQEQIRIGCKLSTIPGFAVGTAFAQGSGMQQPIPSAGDEVSDSA